MAELCLKYLSFSVYFYDVFLPVSTFWTQKSFLLPTSFFSSFFFSFFFVFLFHSHVQITLLLIPSSVLQSFFSCPYWLPLSPTLIIFPSFCTPLAISPYSSPLFQLLLPLYGIFPPLDVISLSEYTISLVFLFDIIPITIFVPPFFSYFSPFLLSLFSLPNTPRLYFFPYLTFSFLSTPYPTPFLYLLPFLVFFLRISLLRHIFIFLCFFFNSGLVILICFEYFSFLSINDLILFAFE